MGGNHTITENRDPFGDLGLKQVDMTGAGYEDMTDTINMDGGAQDDFGKNGADVFGSTYNNNYASKHGGERLNDPFGLLTTPVSVTKLNI